MGTVTRLKTKKKTNVQSAKNRTQAKRVQAKINKVRGGNSTDRLKSRPAKEKVSGKPNVSVMKKDAARTKKIRAAQMKTKTKATSAKTERAKRGISIGGRGGISAPGGGTRPFARLRGL